MERETTISINKQNFITYFRVFAVACILLCHLVQANKNAYIQMTAQFFNVGVDIFIIISGFCFGLQRDIDSSKNWYKKRIKRIYLPYELFLIILAVIYLILGRTFKFENWLSCIIGAQGANVGVLGADHTWFITAILLCYIVTPLLQKMEVQIEKQNRSHLEIIVLLIIPIILSFIPMIVFHTIGTPICFYSIAYILGRKYKQGFRFKKKYLLFYLCGILIGVAERLVGKFIFDGTRIYECNIVSYTQILIAFCLMAVFSVFFNDIRISGVINWIEKISFEIYLYHYMFIVGPVSLMKISNSWIMNSVCVVCVTAIIAYFMKQIEEMLMRKIKRLR